MKNPLGLLAVLALGAASISPSVPRATMKPSLLLITTLLLAPLASLHAADAPMKKPNIILMMGDDHGWEETGYHGHPHVKTPVLDEMAATGLRMDRFYAAHPSCSPTRASFLTGRHPNRMGTFTPGRSFRPEEITSAQILSKEGYHCGHFGKWHVGAVKKESPVCPGAMGFHEWLSHDNFFELNPSLSRNGGPPEVFQGESSAILIDGSFKLVIQETKKGDPKPELFDLKSDPAEKTNLIEQQPATADKLKSQLREWQESVLKSLTGADYTK